MSTLDPLIVMRKDATGMSVFVAQRAASFRRDIAKLNIFPISNRDYTDTFEVKLRETEDRRLVGAESGPDNDGVEFEVRAPNTEKEYDSAERVIDRYKEES